MYRLCTLLAALAAYSAEIPTGTELHLRLSTPISTDRPAKAAFQAVVIIPVIVGAKVYIPAGSTVSGTATAVAVSETNPRATVLPEFTTLHIGSASYPLSARLASLDNARETVDAEGRILGIDAKSAYTTRLEQGLQKLKGSERFGALASILESAKSAVIKDTDPNISYDPGAEFSLRLTRPLSIPAAAPDPPLTPFPDDRALIPLVERQAFQTYSQRPYRPSDITNLMFLGTEEQLKRAFAEAGWSGAARLDDASRFETARALIEQRGYKEAPVSVLLLDERPPEFVFQKGNNTFASRHHLRIWRSPDTFLGLPVWLCSSTHDTGIAFSERDFTFIHKIDPNIDAERAKVVADLLFAGCVKSIALVDRPGVPTHSMNATGDDLDTDGKMAIVLLR